jgi:uncharacterized protein (DUF433 family)
MKLIHEGYIVRNKEIMMGKPCIKGTRITVELILRKISEGATVDLLMDDYPGLQREAILACVDYARAIMLHDEVIELSA